MEAVVFTSDDATVLVVDATAGDADRLRSQIKRRVDVLSAVVAPRPPMSAAARPQAPDLKSIPSAGTVAQHVLRRAAHKALPTSTAFGRATAG